MLEGLTERIKIKDISKNHVLVKETIRLFQLNEISHYRDMFHTLAGIRKNTSANFNDDEWVFAKGVVRKQNCIFRFENVKDKYLKLSLKAYVTLQLTVNVAVTVHKKFSELLDFIVISRELQAPDIRTYFTNYILFNQVENDIKERSQKSRYEISRLWLEYLEFIQYSERYPTIISICNEFNCRDHDQKVRELPKYIDVLIFHEALTLFRKECERKAAQGNSFLLMLYYPFFLWWRITNIIPMRTSEFLLITRECLENDGETYLLLIERIKDPEKPVTQIPVEKEIPITKSLAEDIQRYIDLTVDRHDVRVNQLCSYTTHIGLMKSIGYYERTSLDVAYDSLKMFDDEHMKELRDMFYEVINSDYSNLLFKEVVDGVVTFKSLEKIKMGDTRHFTIYQLRMRGLSALNVARLSGHSKIDQQDKYLRHAKWFSQSEVKLLEERLSSMRALSVLHEDINFETQVNFFDGYFNEIVRRSPVNYEAYLNLPAVDTFRGATLRCKINPLKCPFPGDCVDCPHSCVHPKEWNRDIEGYYIEKSAFLWKRMDEIIDTLVALGSQMEFDFVKKREKDPREKARLDQLAAEKRELQFQQAIINNKLKEYTLVRDLIINE